MTDQEKTSEQGPDELRLRVKELEDALADLSNAIQGLKIQATTGSVEHIHIWLTRSNSWIGRALARARLTLEPTTGEGKEHETD